MRNTLVLLKLFYISVFNFTHPDVQVHPLRLKYTPINCISPDAMVMLLVLSFVMHHLDEL